VETFCLWWTVKTLTVPTPDLEPKPHFYDFITHNSPRSGVLYNSQLTTERSPFLPEKPIFSQLVKKFLDFYVRFISLFARACHMNQFYPVRTFTSYFFKVRFNIDFPSTPRSPKRFLHFRFSTKTLCSLYVSLMGPTFSVQIILLDLIVQSILGEEYQLSESSIQMFPYSCYFLSLRQEYSPQLFILKHRV
jgi:hypothetical protein